MNVFIAGVYAHLNYLFDEDLERLAEYSKTPEGTEMNFYLAGKNYKEEIMNLYLAGEHEVKNGKNASSCGVMILESYVYARSNKNVHKLIPTFKSFLLDSGAYTFMIQAQTKKLKTDWDAYISEYAEFIKHFEVDLFFELDIDRIVGMKEVERLRSKLERLTGKQSIPVWHRSRGLDYWKRMCRDYKYISLSASGNNGSSEWVRTPDGVKAMAQLLKIAGKTQTKVHALGYTKIPVLKFLKFHSVDSTSWLMGNRGGFLYFFTGSDIVKQMKPAGTRLKAREVAIHNFGEWVKFQKYAENNL